MTYKDLNSGNSLIRLLIQIINNKVRINIASNDIIVTNNQTVTDNQASGATVAFTVSTNASSSLNIGNYNFVDNLQ